VVIPDDSEEDEKKEESEVSLEYLPTEPLKIMKPTSVSYENETITVVFDDRVKLTLSGSL
jgi:hypothetical protein